MNHRRREANMVRRVCVLLLCATLLGTGISATAQEMTLDDRLVVFTQNLRMGLTLATVASFSPTITDLHLHAQQLINLLEGAHGDHFVRPAVPTELPEGLLPELTALLAQFEAAPLDADRGAIVTRSAKNVDTYLRLALTSALNGLSQRRWKEANADMLQAFAFLMAAYEKPCDASYVPGLWTILRTYGLAARLEPPGGV
jgi:hypothetical protein